MPFTQKYAIRLALPLAILMLGACAQPQASGVADFPGSDPEHCTRQVADLLHFGLSTPQGVIEEREWQRFLAEEITTRFADGLTVLAAQGQWRDSTGALLREPTRVVEIVHGGDAGSERAIGAIVARYRLRYRQESVLRVRMPVTACF